MRALPLSTLVTVLVVTGLAGCSEPAQTPTATQGATTAPSSPGPADALSASTDWLAAVAPTDGLFTTTFGGESYPDPGLTADAVLAFAAAGRTDEAVAVHDELSTSDAVSSYVGDGTVSQYAGSTAKLAVASRAAGLDPTDVAGRDLLAELAALESATGRFSDLGPDDYSQTVSQSWALLALAEDASVASVDFLASQQCAGGGYPAELVDAPTGSCVADVDATAFVVSALVAAGEPLEDPRVAGAVTWLRDTAQSDEAGAHWTATGSTTPSVNSTAVVAAALVDAGEGADETIAWLTAQVLDSGPDAGAFTLDGAADARSTAQAILALAGTGLVGLAG